MSRALTVSRTTIPASERARYLDRLKARAAHYGRANCKFWVYEEAGLRGAFVEFTEADDAATLSAAHASSPEPILDSARIYQPVELH